MLRTGVLAYRRIIEDEDDTVESGDGGGLRSSSDVFGRALLPLLTARCANSGTGLEGGADPVCSRWGDFSMGNNKPLFRTYSCHFGSLKSGLTSGGPGRGNWCEGDLGTSLPGASPDSLLESVDALGEEFEIIDSGRRLESLRSLLRNLGAWPSSAGDMTAKSIR